MKTRLIGRTLLLPFTAILLTGALAVFQTSAQVPTVPLAQYSSNVVGVATFDPTDLPYRSVLAGTASGELHEIFYRPTTPQYRGDSVIGYFSGITAVAGFYAADDQYRIALVGTQDSNLTEIFYHPYKGKGRSVIANFGGRRIMSIAAYYNPYDRHRIAYVALSDSSIWKVEYHPSIGIRKNFWAQWGQSSVGNILALAANPVAGGLERRLLVSTHLGNLYEYRLNNQSQVLAFKRLVASGPSLTSLGTNGGWTVWAAPGWGAGYVLSTGQLSFALSPGVGFVAADTAARNYNNFIFSRGSAVYTTGYTT